MEVGDASRRGAELLVAGRAPVYDPEDMSEDAIDGRTARWQHRKPELLHMATEYVLDHGVSNLTLRPLAAHLGVTITTVIRQFGSKQELVQLIFEQISAKLVASLNEDPELAGQPAIVIAETLWERWLAIENRREFLLFFELYGVALREREQYGWFFSSAVDEWVSLISDTLQSEGYAADISQTKASALLALLRGLQMDLTATENEDRVTTAFRWSVAAILAQ